MRFPSIDALFRRGYVVLLRFPVTLLAAAAAAITGCLGVTASSPAQDSWVRIAMAVMLVVPLSVALTLAAERRGWRRPVLALLQLAGLAAIWAFYRSWPGAERSFDMLRYAQLSAGLHLLVSVLPFIRGYETGAFWQYNRQLFLAFLRAAVFSAVLFLGLAIAIAALDKLFGVKVPSELYAQLWLVIALLANTWIFLAGLSDDVTMLEGEYSYPRALKVFTQYVLTPLVALYLVLLIAYLAKIVLTREWPSGWIGWLVGTVSVTGILGFLLVHPLRHSGDEGWIRLYARGLFIGLIPAAAMLILALAKRIGPYGLTELRVIALALAVWLLAIALMYSLTRDTGVRAIPLSLLALLTVLLAGPMSATSFALRSQTARLHRLLSQVTTRTAPAPDDRETVELSAAVRYLLAHRQDRTLERAFGVAVARDTGRTQTVSDDSLGRMLLAARGIRYALAWGNAQYHSINRPDSLPLETRGYDWLLAVEGPDSGRAIIGNDTLRYASDTLHDEFRVMHGADTLRFELAPVAAALADTAAERQRWSDGPFTFRRDDAAFRGALVIRSASRYGAAGMRWNGSLLLAPR